MYLLALWAVLFLPFMGLIIVNISPDEYEWLTLGESTAAPIVLYAIFLIGAIIAAFQFNKQFLKVEIKAPGIFKSEIYLLAILTVILIVVLTVYGGVDVLTGLMSKEDVRQSGFVGAMLTKYMAPSFFACISARRRAMLVSQSQWLIAFFAMFVIGLSTGGKASALIAVLPGLAILLDGRVTFFKLLGGCFAVFIFLIIAAWLFDPFLDRNIFAIPEYLARRAFILTAEAPFRVSVADINNQFSIEYGLTLFEIFGKSVLSNFIPPEDMHKYIFSHAITAWLYPDQVDNITSGAWNITPNVFVEALIVGEWYLLPIFGFVVVYVGYFIWSLVVKFINRGEYVNASIASVYSVFVYLSWVNSAGVMQLIHPLVIGSLALSWLMLKVRF